MASNYTLLDMLTTRINEICSKLEFDRFLTKDRRKVLEDELEELILKRNKYIKNIEKKLKREKKEE
tara:strand:+ start:154 stop:351 length:198 start_codon:yes stop_codon:yes gene_type:complete